MGRHQQLAYQRYPSGVPTTCSQLPGIGLVTGQVGLAWNAALLYVKGGAAVTGNTYEILTTVGGDVVATAVTSRWGGIVAGY